MSKALPAMPLQYDLQNFNLNLHYVGPLQKDENSFYYTLKRYQTFVHANTTNSQHLRPTYVDVGIMNTFLFSNEVFTESTMKTSNYTIIATLRQR